MNAKRVTLLLFVTAISLLTIFLVVLLDDTVLAGNNSEYQLLRNLNLYQMEPQGMVATNQLRPQNNLRHEPEPLEVV